jgi:hypothetical protein
MILMSSTFSLPLHLTKIIPPSFLHQPNAYAVNESIMMNKQLLLPSANKAHEQQVKSYFIFQT